jgi:hypothetical protein
MAQIPPEYEVLTELTDLMKELVNLNSEKFYGVDVDTIRAYSITNKDRGEKQKKLWDLKSIPMPIRLDCQYTYFVVIHQSDWDQMFRWQKGLVVLDILHGIPGAGEEGKILPMDLKDYSPIIRTFGADYLCDEPNQDLFAGPVKWKDEPLGTI